MKRREFIAGLGSTAAAGSIALPLAAHAQQRALPVVGFLHNSSPEAIAHYLEAFRTGLSQAGFVEGRNVAIEYRWARNENDRLPQLAADLVRRRVAVIATPGNPQSALAAKAATTTVPIVFSGSNPVSLGLVASLNRPGGNGTGIGSMVGELSTKQIGLLHELVPRATRYAMLFNPESPSSPDQVADVRTASSRLGLSVEFTPVSRVDDVVGSVAGLVPKRIEALFVQTDSVFGARRTQLALLAARYEIPAIYSDRLAVEAGGLMSYGPNATDQYRQVGIYTGRILKGEKPADLPVMQPTKFELVINLQTAAVIGLDIPPTLLAEADEVIE